MIDKDVLRSDKAALVAALQDAGAVFRGNACRCPFHEDEHASAGVYVKDNAWRFHCHVCNWGGDIFDVKARLAGTTPADELKAAGGSKPHGQAAPKRDALAFASLDAVRAYLTAKVGQIESEYPYLSADGDMVQVVFRCRSKDGKTFRPVHLADAGYCLSAAAKPWVLYNLPAVVKAESVVIVEGEKCSDVLTRYGFTACTSAGGAKNAKNTDWTPLAGKTVILWPDFDAEGRRYAADVESILQGLQPTPRLSVIDPASLDLGEAEDVADLVGQLHVVGKSDAVISAALADALKTAKTLSIAGEVRQRIADIKAGRYAAIRWPWEFVTSLTNALLPGERTTIVGSPGATKTFLILQAVWYWLSLGLKVALYEAEQSRVYHLFRALAQRTRNTWLTDPNAVKQRADEADEIAREHADFLDSFGRVLHTAPEVQSLEHLIEWMDEKAKAGCRIIAADPVTAFLRTGKPWEADDKFLRAVERIGKTYGCSIILVTHCIKNATGPDMGQVAGGAAYERFTQTILWTEYHKPEKTSRIKTVCGTAETEHNVTISILKANNGIGRGYKLAFQFDIESLTLHEVGLILGKKKD